MNIVDEFFKSVANLPMMPKVVLDVMQALRDSDIDFNDLSKKVEHDQVLMAKVLRMANSTYYGATKTIKTVDDAIAMIGTSRLGTLVVASGVTRAFNSVPGLDLKRFWLHSLLTASIARQIAQKQSKQSETAYLAGLMHNIGQLLIHIVFPGGAAEVDEVCKGRSVEERRSVEMTTLGIDHCQVGQELAKRWNFPDDIQHVIRYYADPLNPQACDLAPVVYMAAHIAFGFEHQEEAAYIAETLNQDVAKALNINPADWVDRIESYRGLLEEAEYFVS